jgi:hypothetical protein
MPILERHFKTFSEEVLKSFSPEQIEHEKSVFFSGALVVYQTIMSTPPNDVSMETTMRDIGESVKKFHAEMAMKSILEELFAGKENPND